VGGKGIKVVRMEGGKFVRGKGGQRRKSGANPTYSTVKKDWMKQVPQKGKRGINPAKKNEK